jgi:hypothetical protein
MEETIKSNGTCQAVVLPFVGGTEMSVPEMSCRTLASFRFHWLQPWRTPPYPSQDF